MATVSRGGTQERFRFVAQHRERYGVRRLCRFLRVSASGFYAWLKRSVSPRVSSDAALTERIKRIFEASRETYGNPRVHQALKRKESRWGRSELND